MKKEIWVDIPGYEGLYKVSNIGRVFSIRNNIILKYRIHNRGYNRVSLCSDKTIDKLVHRLVAESFYGKSCLDINHIDGDKKNNNLDNLEYCTKKENTNHAIKIGLIDVKGENSVCGKLKNKDIYLIRKLHTEYNIQQKTIALIFGVSKNTIYKIMNNRTWCHI